MVIEVKQHKNAVFLFNLDYTKKMQFYSIIYVKYGIMVAIWKSKEKRRRLFL